MSLIEVHQSGTHGLGVFATTDIPRRRFIAAYAGRRHDAGETLSESDDGVTYLFALSDGRTIDGGDGGNETRYINHSCRPNCEAVEAYDEEDDLVVEIRAKRGIRAGQELFLDYALIVSESREADYVCLCKERVCRGTMAASR